MSSGKRAVIFGGTRGIGLAVALKFLSKGFNVSVLSRTRENVASSIQTLTQAKTSETLSIEGYICDVSRPQSVADAMKEVSNKGAIDVLVNGAGVNVDKLLVKASDEEIANVIQTNLIGTIVTCKYALKTMMRQRKGSIVNIGSVVGLKGNAGQTVYSASKAGLVGFTKSLAKEVASKGISVNLVAPGFVETLFTKNIDRDQMMSKIAMKRIGSPAEIAEAVYFLSTASYITGEVLTVDGGLNI